jgi:hypothetical protein
MSTQLNRYTVRFAEWTVYAVDIEADSEHHAIELAMAGIESGDLWNYAIAKDGNQDDWCAFPAERKESAAHDQRLAMLPYNGLELTPCAVVGFANGVQLVEPCEPEAAHFWTVYGHFRTGGVHALKDFPDRESARAFANNMLNAHPHLNDYGLTDNGCAP